MACVLLALRHADLGPAADPSATSARKRGRASLVPAAADEDQASTLC